jgi:hypothetical protein
MKKKQLPFDSKKIGKIISISGEHIVYQYGNKKVIKFPFGPIYLFDSIDAYNKAARDFKLIKRYLKDYIVNFKIFFYEHNKHKKYCIIQDFVVGKPYRLSDSKNLPLKKQLLKIVSANRKMEKETGFVLEYFGIKVLVFHFFFQRMDNVIVTQDNRLKIIDNGLISAIKPITKSKILTFVINWAIKRQKKLLEKYL